MWVVTSYCVHMVYANRRAMMQPLKVGIREFRAQLPHYLLEVGEPIAVTRHGATIGYFIPTHAEKKSFDFTALKQAAAQLQEALAAANVSEAELIAEYRQLRACKSNDI